MKRKTNISVQDNRGIRVTSNMIVGEEFNGYSSGDILDANATIELVKYLIRLGIPMTGLVTSENIEDNSIRMVDLNSEITDKINNSISANYNPLESAIELTSNA